MWFRVDDGLVDDPKVQLLSGDMVKALLNLWCLTSQNGGILPSMEAMSFKLRMKPQQIAAVIAELSRAGLIDQEGEEFRPHNWDKRQYRSDRKDETAAERMRRYRSKQRNVTDVTRNDDCNVTDSNTVTVTVPRADTEQIQIQSRERAADAATRRKPKLPMPDIFPLSEKCRAYAGEKGLAGDRADQVFSKFKNYHQSKGSVFASWDAAWRTWVDNEISFTKTREAEDDVYRNVL